MEFLIAGVLALFAIAAATAFSPRVGVAAPLLLVAFGYLVSLLPFVPEIEIEPEVILSGVLPPLLYAAAVQIPATDFRREFRTIGGLAVLLVLVSTAAMAVFFHWVIPDLTWPWAFALGAIVSPTDPVATAIIKRLGVAPRVVSILEGESMLNDATALILLRGAIAVAAAAVSLWGVAVYFVLAVVVSSLIGFVVGKFNLWLRRHVRETPVNTVISFAVPFVASIPAEAVGASGLVAAVVAGLVTGHGAPRVLPPQHRLSDHQNWRSIELILEGSVYLIMGLELLATVRDVEENHAGVLNAVWIALAALGVVLLVRAAYIAPLLWGLGRRAERAVALRPRIAEVQERLADPDAELPLPERRFRSGLRRRAPDRNAIHRRLTRVQADISHFESAPLGWREGTLAVWAGMRGVVTVAAAQTLPADTPNRSLLVLVAYIVALVSLGLQGGTAGLLVRWLKPAPGLTREERLQERHRLDAILDAAADDERAHIHESGVETLLVEHHIELLKAKRRALLETRRLGTFNSDVLSDAMEEIDADQVRMELREESR